MNGAVGADLVSRGRLSVAALAEPSLSATSSYAWRPAAARGRVTLSGLRHAEQDYRSSRQDCIVNDITIRPLR